MQKPNTFLHDCVITPSNDNYSKHTLVQKQTNEKKLLSLVFVCCCFFIYVFIWGGGACVSTLCKISFKTITKKPNVHAANHIIIQIH